MKIHFIFDVDDTLMVNLEGLVFNQAAISILKAYGVSEISLLTKMDVKKVSVSAPIRVELIEHLERVHGIRVKVVMAPIDLLYRSVDSNPDAYRMGTAYRNWMKPVEESIARVKKTLPKDLYLAHKKYRDHCVFYQAFRYCLENSLLNFPDLDPLGLCKTVLENKALLNKRIDEHLQRIYYPGYGKRAGEIDFDVFTKEIRPHIASIMNDDNMNATLQELLDALDKTTKALNEEEREKGLPPLSSEQAAALDEYYQEAIAYRNFNYYSHTKVPEEHYTKGEVYAHFVREQGVSKDDVVIFIDDNEKEHESLRAWHVNERFTHQLETIYPPMHTGFNISLCVDPVDFMKLLDPTYRRYVKSLNDAGLKAEKEKNYGGAICYFKTAYLYNNLISQGADIKTEKDVLRRAVEARVKWDKEFDKTQTLPVDNTDIETVFQAMKSNDFQGRMRIMVMHLKMHKISHPKVYNKPFISWGSEPNPADDHFFKSTIVKGIAALMVDFPEQLTRCNALLEALIRDIILASYKTFINHELEIQLNLVNSRIARPVLDTVMHAEECAKILTPTEQLIIAVTQVSFDEAAFDRATKAINEGADVNCRIIKKARSGTSESCYMVADESDLSHSLTYHQKTTHVYYFSPTSVTEDCSTSYEVPMADTTTLLNVLASSRSDARTIAIAELLMENGAELGGIDYADYWEKWDKTAKNYFQNTPLLTAIANQNLPFAMLYMRFLSKLDIEQRKEILDYKDKFCAGFHTALEFAIRRGYCELARQIVLLGADLNPQPFIFSYAGESPLHMACMLFGFSRGKEGWHPDLGSTLELILTLIEQGADFNLTVETQVFVELHPILGHQVWTKHFLSPFDFIDMALQSPSMRPIDIIHACHAPASKPKLRGQIKHPFHEEYSFLSTRQQALRSFYPDAKENYLNSDEFHAQDKPRLQKALLKRILRDFSQQFPENEITAINIDENDVQTVVNVLLQHPQQAWFRTQLEYSGIIYNPDKPLKLRVLPANDDNPVLTSSARNRVAHCSINDYESYRARAALSQPTALRP